VSAPRAALLALACMLTGLAVYGFFAFPAKSDFAVFYQEGLAWTHDAALYQSSAGFPNLNPPLLTVAVFAPLARVSLRGAQLVWIACELAGLVGAVRIIRTETGRPWPSLVTATALLLLTQGAFIATLQGQLTWLLIYPVTRAWAAYRHDRLIAAGLWLAPAIAAKPPLALLALLLPWPVWMTAGIVAGGVAGLAILVTGFAPWIAWLRLSGAVSWLPSPFNASLWGMAARWSGRARMGELSTGAIAIVIVASSVFAWRAWQQTDRDRRVVLAVLVSVLVSPLGWGYYLPLAFGPALATWPRSGLAWTAYALSLAPVGGGPALPPVLASVCFAAVICAWIAWTRRPPGGRMRPMGAWSELERTGGVFYGFPNFPIGTRWQVAIGEPGCERVHWEGPGGVLIEPAMALPVGSRIVYRQVAGPNWETSLGNVASGTIRIYGET
jgi:hypothetical protein